MSVNILIGMILSLGLLICVWGMIANERTYRQRMLIIDNAYRHRGNRDFFALVELYDRVDYNTHAWRVFLFRDYRSLYAPPICEIMNWPSPTTDQVRG